MRTHVLVLVLAAFLVVAPPSPALEKVPARLDVERADTWNAGGTITLQYYNVCTGWIWILTGFAASDRFGVCFDWPDWGMGPSLVVSWHYVYSGTPAGYGFTGSIAVSAADANCCPSGLPIESQTFLPVTGWNVCSWSSMVPRGFVIHATLGAASGSPLALPTDHPGPVAGGPPACGTCYPTSRVNHSYYYGPNGACPGSVFFNDGVCDAQLLWDCGISVKCAVEPQSWGGVKSLYR